MPKGWGEYLNEALTGLEEREKPENFGDQFRKSLSSALISRGRPGSMLLGSILGAVPSKGDEAKTRLSNSIKALSVLRVNEQRERQQREGHAQEAKAADKFTGEQLTLRPPKVEEGNWRSKVDAMRSQLYPGAGGQARTAAEITEIRNRSAAERFDQQRQLAALALQYKDAHSRGDEATVTQIQAIAPPEFKKVPLVKEVNAERTQRVEGKGRAELPQHLDEHTQVTASVDRRKHELETMGTMLKKEAGPDFTSEYAAFMAGQPSPGVSDETRTVLKQIRRLNREYARLSTLTSSERPLTWRDYHGAQIEPEDTQPAAPAANAQQAGTIELLPTGETRQRTDLTPEQQRQEWGRSMVAGEGRTGGELPADLSKIQRVNSQAEFDALPPGTFYINPSNQIAKK